jgi:molybdopterin-binding protein
MKLSARNVIAGTVKQINVGDINDEVIVEIAGGQEIVSVITKSSVENLGLRKGVRVYAVVKASNVILAVD